MLPAARRYEIRFFSQPFFFGSPSAVGAVSAGAASARRLLHRRRQFGGEILEELASQLLGGGVDQPRAELGDLAADLRVDVVMQRVASSPSGSS